MEPLDSAFSRPAKNNRFGTLDRHLDPGSFLKNIIVKYGRGDRRPHRGQWGVHSVRATAATNALSSEEDIAKIQEWAGDANISTTHLY